MNPSARVLWRTPTCVQLEVGDQAVLLDGVDPAQLVHLSALARDRATAAVPRLAAESLALCARRGTVAGDVLSARSQRRVVLLGTGRIAAHVAALLAASGIGHVGATSNESVRLADTAPGGAGPEDEGRRYRDATNSAVRRIAPDLDVDVPAALRPDLAILVSQYPVDADQRAELHANGTPHLAVHEGPNHAVIGPLVLPSHTSCLRCAELHRGDRDPKWPALAVQLAVPTRFGSYSEVALCAAAAGVAAMQALQFLDGAAPASIDGTLEFHLPDWRLRRRSWSVHPDCDCR